MDEKIKGWWDNNKLIFLLLLPIILIWMFKDLIFAAIAGSAHKVSSEAKKEDAALRDRANELDKKAALAKAEADAAAKRIADRKESDVDENWHKKS